MLCRLRSWGRPFTASATLSVVLLVLSSIWEVWRVPGISLSFSGWVALDPWPVFPAPAVCGAWASFFFLVFFQALEGPFADWQLLSFSGGSPSPLGSFAAVVCMWLQVTVQLIVQIKVNALQKIVKGGLPYYTQDHTDEMNHIGFFNDM